MMLWVYYTYDSFGYNARSELTSATLGNANYAYAFDNIGNRETSSEAGTALAYTANNLNQYTEICSAEPIQQTATPSAQLSALQLSYDADGNATLIQTSTGTWAISYNGANRPVRFRNEETDTTVECGYDSQGRRYFKKVTVAGTVTLHHRYIYRGYLQIACVDCTRSGHPALWFVTWDPSQATATRPLAIQKDGTWFTYGYDLTKNICEVFGPAGYIRTAYSYAPFGAVSESGDVSQPFQWSSEHYDSELDLVYYNFRHYSPSLGRFLSRDPIAEQGGLNLYAFVKNSFEIDSLGLINRSRSSFEACKEHRLDSFDIGINLPSLGIISLSLGINGSGSSIRCLHCCPSSGAGVYDTSVNAQINLFGDASVSTFHGDLGIAKFWLGGKATLMLNSSLQFIGETNSCNSEKTEGLKICNATSLRLQGSIGGEIGVYTSRSRNKKQSEKGLNFAFGIQGYLFADGEIQVCLLENPENGRVRLEARACASAGYGFKADYYFVSYQYEEKFSFCTPYVGFDF